jgi:putative peptide modification system cyclase
MAIPSPDHAGRTLTPLLRAVLLADLADSTAMVERLGDMAAAHLLQKLDLRIRDLIEFTGGRLIDKADGLLVLFERPIQAVDFALRYQQLLRQVERDEAFPLRARVGIHVGELMAWTNPAGAVAAGAKPLEVEGLAKPVAARLMALAIPGQILMTSMAQTLAQRAQTELGERSERLRWLVHGRYRFKGVPAAMLVHEVGEIGAAPLAAPPSNAKAWRELPLWKRPPVVAAELLVLFALGGFYLYGAFRSPPAMAFHARDWVVLGDVSNFTDDPRFEDSVETALRLDLEQSRHVNVVSDLKVKATLERMGRSEHTVIDRAIGSEIALREGARALLLPTVAEVGNRLRVSVEVVDPNSQTTVFAEFAEGRGAESVLASLDTVNERLRERLGESLPSIQATGQPLAEVTTSNLDALRAFSLAETATYQSRDADALALYQQALAGDPNFSMAQLGIARIRAINGETAEAKRLALTARANTGRMTQRERLELDTFIARFGPVTELLPKYKLLASLYPDSFRAYYGYSITQFGNHGYRDALDFLTPALSPKNPAYGNAYFLQGAILLALNRYDDARAAFQQSEALGVAGEKLEFAETYAAQRDYAAAGRVLASQTQNGLPGAFDLRLHQDDPVFLLDQGRWDEAMASLAKLQKSAEEVSAEQSVAFRGAQLALDGYRNRLRPAQWHAFVAERLRELESNDPLVRDGAIFPALAVGWLAARNGDLATAKSALAKAKNLAQASGDASAISMATIVEAELALSTHQPRQAIELLTARQDGSELYFSHAVLMRAEKQAGDPAAALEQANWLINERGRAYGEFNYDDMWSGVNIVESNLALLSAAELQAKRGQPKLAQRELDAFLAAWPGAGKLPWLRDRLALAMRG